MSPPPRFTFQHRHQQFIERNQRQLSEREHLPLIRGSGGRGSHPPLRVGLASPPAQTHVRAVCFSSLRGTISSLRRK